MKKNFESNLVNLMLLFIGIVLFISAQSIKMGVTNSLGGDFVPKIATGLWVVVTAMLFITGLRSSEADSKQMNLLGLLKTFVLLLIYILLLKTLGFLVDSILYLGVQMYLFLPKELHSKKNYILIAILAIVVPILTDIVFVNVFSLILPASRLF